LGHSSIFLLSSRRGASKLQLVFMVVCVVCLWMVLPIPRMKEGQWPGKKRAAALAPVCSGRKERAGQG
jgi:hypothetical protein